VLSVNTDSDVTLKNVTITGGNLTTSDGGGYQHDGTGNLTIVDSTIADNTGCTEGGGVEVEEADAVSIIRSTLSGNRSFNQSAIDLDEGGSLLLENSTVTGNVADTDGAVYGEDDPENDGVLQLVYTDVVGNISIVLAGFDPATKQYVGTDAVIKAQIAQVKADKEMSPSDKKEALAELNDALKAPVPPIENKGNIDLVAKYYDKLADALGDDEE